MRVLAVLVLVLGMVSSCSKGQKEAPAVLTPIDFTPWNIEDPTKNASLPSGLQMYPVLEGPGEYPKHGQTVHIHYHGMLSDGKVFDSSFKRGQSFSFKIGSGKVIPGLDEGIRNLRMGSKAILTIPPDLAYGEKGDEPNIPGNSTLIFHVEFLGIF